jgi:hypothetical protein
MENLKQGQSILDFTVQHTGSVEGLFDLLNLNGLKNLNSTDELLKVPSSLRPKVVAYFNQNKIVPSAYKTVLSPPPPPPPTGAYSNSYSNAYN